MAVITICEKVKTETGFDATLIIEGNSYPIIVSEPFNTRQEQELEWYFEDWLIYPMLDNVKADRAKASVREYGEELFRQVFQSDSAAYRKYSELKQNLSQLTIEIVSINPEFQAIHWEALRDPELKHPLAIKTTLIRKSSQPKKVEIEVQESPTINLLVVVARPNAEDDIPHRTISRPLVEAIRKAKLRVNIEILRPGTYEALAKHLEAKGNGYYHIVHFDVHGSLQSYAIYKERLETGIYPESRYGRDEIAEYDGFKAFLALEGEEIGEYDPVEASEIANLLTSKDIPVCILNACQSGKQLNKAETEDNRETSLDSRLLNAGMQMVVAMSYTVTVTAAEIMMQQLYEHLFDEQDINQAILSGRKELYNCKARKAAYNTEIDLEDWLLPVVYSNGEVTFNLREFTPEEATEYNLNLESKYKFVEPNYGFVGRDIDILLIEKNLLYHNILLLQGMGGTGKTNLLNYLREWWQVTKFAEDTFYFAYDRRAYNLQQIIFEISKQLYNQFNFDRFQAKNLSEQCQEISQKLRNNSYSLILDNLESITGQPLAIQNTLEETEKTEIKNFLASLVSGKTKVILCSRIAEEWLKESTFQDNSYQLRGLDAQASSDLAANILQKIASSCSLDDIKTDEHFQRLMKLLAGNPLTIKVILPNLKDKSPKEVLEQLEKAEIAPGGDNKENNIIKCVEYSYNNLSESSQKLLLLLAPFHGFIVSSVLQQFTKQLKNIKVFQKYDLDNIETAVMEAINWGLLSHIDKEDSQFFNIHPLLPYFLNRKLKKCNEETKAALQERFKYHYRVLAYYYTELMQSKEAKERQRGITFVSWEYENLYRALQICLEKQETILSIVKCLIEYLDIINAPIIQLKLLESTYTSLSRYSTEKRNSRCKQEIIGVLSNLVNFYLPNKNIKQAKEIHRKILNKIKQIKDEEIESRLKHLFFAGTRYQLGSIAKEQEQYKQAKDYYEQALNIFIEYEEHHSQAKTFNELSIIALESREFSEAKNYCKKAIDIYDESDDLLAKAVIFNNLGLIAQELREYSKAQNYFEKVLAIRSDYADIYSKAGLLYNLGRVTQQQRKFQEADSYYKQAIDIYSNNKDRKSQASILHNLGIMAQQLGEYQQAYDYYRQVLNIHIKPKNERRKADTLYQLGTVSQDLKKFQDARNYLNRALTLYKKFGDSHKKASTLHSLGRVAQELKEYNHAMNFYQQALALFREHGDVMLKANTHGQLGILAEILGEWGKAKSNYLDALIIFARFKDEYKLILTVGNLARLYQKNLG